MMKFNLNSPKNFRKEEYQRILKLTNQQLLDETIFAARGDDYDGEFTDRGAVTFELLKHELYNRLVDWLNK